MYIYICTVYSGVHKISNVTTVFILSVYNSQQEHHRHKDKNRIPRQNSIQCLAQNSTQLYMFYSMNMDATQTI